MGRKLGCMGEKFWMATGETEVSANAEKMAAALAAAAALLVSAAHGAPATGAAKPNIIFVLTVRPSAPNPPVPTLAQGAGWRGQDDQDALLNGYDPAVGVGHMNNLNTRVRAKGALFTNYYLACAPPRPPPPPFPTPPLALGPTRRGLRCRPAVLAVARGDPHGDVPAQPRPHGQLPPQHLHLPPRRRGPHRQRVRPPCAAAAARCCRRDHSSASVVRSAGCRRPGTTRCSAAST